MNKIELLSPCGDMERFELALQYGADAVYLGRSIFGMRAAPKNFNDEELFNAVKYAHSIGKKVYLTCNTYPHSADFAFLPDFLKSSE